MAKQHTTEFQQEAVRVALTSGLNRKQVAADFGIGFLLSLVGFNWSDRYRQNQWSNLIWKMKLPICAKRTACFVRRGIFKKGHHIFCGAKAMRFKFIEDNRDVLAVKRLCDLMAVSSRGYRAWRSRPTSLRQRGDMVLLAHIREQYRLSLGSYGRPRMTEELKELGLMSGIAALAG